MPHRFHLALFLILGSLLSACSFLPTGDTYSNASHWSFHGKIGITTPEESVAAFIRWQQSAEEFDIYVTGPLAQGSTRIQGDRQQVSITQGGKTHQGIHPDRFIQEQLGWSFPIENLPYWLQGQIAPFSSATKEMEEGKLAHLIQDQWKVEFLRYHKFYELPQRIKISQGQWKFLIVIKDWSINS